MRHRFTETGTLEVLQDGVWTSCPPAARDLLRVVSDLLAAYVADEDRYNRSEGEPFGSIRTDTGMLAREAVRKFATKR